VNPPPKFLSLEDVLTLHAIAIEDQGGDSTLRDRGLLESALAMPAQQFSGQFLHEGIPAMAAAYAFHICKNHPFVDGNKRAAVSAMIAFLSENGWSFDASADEAEPEVRALAASNRDKAEFTNWAKQHMHEKPRMELRDFFHQVDPLEFNERFRSLLPGETSADPREFLKRAEEAAGAMPLLLDLGRQQQECHARGDTAGWEKITMLAVGLLTLYAIAEDLGYEW
jgi:death-on-curing protein